MIARGRVRFVRELMIEAAMPPLAQGSRVRIACADGWRHGTVAGSGYDDIRILVHGTTKGITPGAVVEEVLAARTRRIGTAVLGRAFTADDVGVATSDVLDPSGRTPVDTPLWTGVRAIDTLLTIGRGARVGIFGAAGAGKSTLLETLIRGVRADAVVLALIGERGREAERWFARLDARTTAVAATSDASASERIAAAEAAFAQAYALARRGLHVLLVLDSFARFAYALRERAVACGEPVGRAGYPASTFSTMASLAERAGSFRDGSISLVATVLNDGEEDDPVTECARSLLDGHITLSTALAHAGRFPAIDVLRSASRTMNAVASAEHREAAATVRRALAALQATSELRSLGIAPSDPATIAAVAAEARIELLLRQGSGPADPSEGLGMLLDIADTLGEPHGHQF